MPLAHPIPRRGSEVVPDGLCEPLVSVDAPRKHHPIPRRGSEVAPDVPDGLPKPLVCVDAPGEDAAGDPVEELQVNPGPLLPLLGEHNFSLVFVKI
jgi:hypothetical protein